MPATVAVFAVAYRFRQASVFATDDIELQSIDASFVEIPSNTTPTILRWSTSGFAMDRRIEPAVTGLEKSAMRAYKGIIVHQTGDAARVPVANIIRYWANTRGSGTHFIIDRNGTVYQTASIKSQCWHVGKLRPRCKLPASQDPARPSPAPSCNYPAYGPSMTSAQRDAIASAEAARSVPARFPANADSIGIEVVGAAPPPGHSYETASAAQNLSLKWLVQSLIRTFNIDPREVWRHPIVSYKEAEEAKTCQWT